LKKTGTRKKYMLYIQQHNSKNFSNLEKEMSIQVRKPPGHKADMVKIEPLHGMLSLKQFQKAKKDMKKCSQSLALKEMHTKPY
jgi:hypothetical protein